MPVVSISAELAAAPERVWALVSDLSRYDEWNTDHAGFPDGIPELAPGATYREDLRILGTPGQVTWTVTEVDAPNRLTLDGAGPMGVTLGQVLSLSASGDGTTVTLKASFDGGPVAGPMGMAIACAGEKAAAESLRKLGTLV